MFSATGRLFIKHEILLKNSNELLKYSDNYRLKSYDQKAGSEEDGFHLDVEIWREGDDEIVSIRVHLALVATPPFHNFTDYEFTVTR